MRLVRPARATLGAALACASLLAGCAADGSAAPAAPTPGTATSTPVPTSATPLPSTSGVDPQAQAKAAVLAAYATFMDARNKSLNDPRKPPDRRLFQVSIPPARDQLYNLVLDYRQQGIAVRGATTSETQPVRLEGRAAMFDDCLDSHLSMPVFIKTGKSALAPNQVRRVVIRVEAVNDGGVWWVNKWTPERGNTC